jgi:hypothetical protein
MQPIPGYQAFGDIPATRSWAVPEWISIAEASYKHGCARSAALTKLQSLPSWWRLRASVEKNIAFAL